MLKLFGPVQSERESGTPPRARMAFFWKCDHSAPASNGPTMRKTVVQTALMPETARERELEELQGTLRIIRMLRTRDLSE
jgi:hypothetical protein